MAITNFIPELWESDLLVALRNRHVFGNLVNRNYQGTIRNAGDTVRITTPSAITVLPYAGAVNYQVPVSTQQSLLIDQDVYWAFEIDDADAAQANVSLMQAYMQEAAYSLADSVDTNLANLYVDAGLTDIALDVGGGGGGADFYDALVTAGQYLDEANVPREGRWVVMTPRGYSDLLQNAFFINATDAGANLIRSGALGMAAGMSIYVSNNIVNSAGATFQYMYGTNAAITYAEQLIKTEAIRRDAAFNDAVRGRLVFGRRVVRPNALGCIVADETP